ncbi:MAG: hypothetical protein IIB65_03065 [Proteobacteria bacterium]|nr:hypothetical protein [Pseudomonadota bacterium]
MALWDLQRTTAQERSGDLMPVEITTSKLFELLGSVYAEVRVLGEENARLNTENQALKVAAAPPVEEKSKRVWAGRARRRRRTHPWPAPLEDKR